MAMTTCPSCGKPLRPGARFCGSCGSPIPAAPPPGQQVEAVCPHCGKPVRPGVKFCSNCGKPVSQEAEGTAAPAGAPTGLASAPPAPKEPPGSAAVKPGTPPPSASRRKGSGKKYWIGIVLIISLIILCVVVVSAVYLYRKDPFHIRNTETPAPTMTLEAVQSPLPSETVSPTETLAPSKTPSPTATLEQRLTPTQSEQPTILPTSPTPTKPGLTTPTESSVVSDNILDEGFDENWERDWSLWGEPEAESETVFEETFLKLTGEPRMSGVTSRTVIPIRSGIVVQFSARLPDVSTQDMLVFDWDQGEDFRKPGDGSGEVFVTIREAVVTLKTPFSPQTCEMPVQSGQAYIITISVEEGLQLSFDVDGQSCRLVDSGLKLGSARLSFSGQGWVDFVKAGAQ